MGGVIGDKVYIPGSPVISLPELLNEAEVSVHLEGEDSPHRARSPLGSVKFPVTPQYDSTQFETPTRKPSSISKPFLDPNDIPSLRRQSLRTPMDFPTPAPRQWSKDDWRLMDGCYTDERYALSERLGLGVEEMADADQVDLMNVVERYVEVIGGQGTVDVLGESWTRFVKTHFLLGRYASDWDFVVSFRENLLKRARALQRKQHSGNAAPPTPARASSVLSNDTATGSYQRYMSSMSPEPAPSQDISYSLLMDDAIAVASDQPKQPIITSYLKSQPAPRRRQSAFGRMKGFFFSYLSTAPKPKPAPPKGPAQPGYPIPPPEVFQKPRGPVSTPASKAPPKPVHPKEIVNLQPAPSKSSENQRNPKDPKRLVDLHPVPQPLEPEPQPISRERRGSNASVKDLVHSFEEMQRRQSMELDKERESLSRLEMRRTRSIREWNGGNPRAAKLNGTAKPVWKP